MFAEALGQDQRRAGGCERQDRQPELDRSLGWRAEPGVDQALLQPQQRVVALRRLERTDGPVR